MTELVGTLLPYILNAFTSGLQLVLLASGLTIILGMQGIFNFSHGAFYMVGAYLAHVLFFSAVKPVSLTDLALGAIFTFALLAMIGMITERLLLRPLDNRDESALHQLILTFGLAFILIEGVELIWGPEFRSASVPDALLGTVSIGPASYPLYWLFSGAVTIVMVGGLVALFKYTKVGVVIRSITHDSQMAQALGHDVSKINLAVFGLGSGIAGLAGVFAPPVVGAGVHPEMGTNIIVSVIVVIIFGGLGSIRGTIIAGLIVGAVLTAGTVLFGSFIAQVFVSAILVAVLVKQPEGLYGVKGVIE